MMLLSLAPELIQAINHELRSIEDVKSFRLTCKQTDQALATEVLRRITVNINEKTYERELRKLQYLVSAAEGSLPSPTILGIKQLDIGSLSPALNHKERAEISAETLKYYEELKKCLYNALSSLTAVRTARWIPATRDDTWAHTSVMDALKAFPHLQSLSIELIHCRIEIPFHFFTALRHISVRCVREVDKCPVNHRKTFKNLIKMISQCPLLESIDFTNACGDYRERNILRRSLHHLFERYPENVPPLRLKHLSLGCCLVRLDDEIVMRHLRYLTSLSLEDLLEPLAPRYTGYPDYPDPPNPKNDPEMQTRWGSSYEQIWRTIYNADLRLEEITLDMIPSAFLEYIGSYSGLKKLIVGAGGLKDGVTSDTAAKKFYEALAKHAGSIEELDVKAYYEGLWCFGHHNKALFSTMQHLKMLSVYVQSDDFVPSSEQDIIKILIDTVVICMPQIQALSVSIAESEDYRDAMVFDLDPDFHNYSQEIAARVLKYKAPWGCKRLPTLTVSLGPKRVFVGQSPDLLKKGERLGYYNMDTDANEEI